VETSKDLYRLLELPRGASREDVRKAHRRLVRGCHPDANPGDDSAEERFKEVQHAYEVLSDPRKRREYDEVLWRASSRGGGEPDRARVRRGHSARDTGREKSTSGEDLSVLVRKLVDLLNSRHVNSWKASVSVLALFLIIDGFLFYGLEQPENSVPEPPTTASTSQSIATSAEAGEGRRAETRAEENVTHPDAIDHEQQDSSFYLRETEPMATEDLSPYPLSSTASANYPTPDMAEEGLTTILPTSVTAADYYSSDSLYEDGYYLADPLYEDSYYLADPLYEDSYYLPDPLYPYFEEEVDYE
jgi:curved DNA-binding protein CbpA